MQNAGDPGSSPGWGVFIFIKEKMKNDECVIYMITKKGSTQVYRRDKDGWTELLSQIKKSDGDFHPKTVNGCVWKLVEKFLDKVYKPEKGLFKLMKYKGK